MEKQNLYSLTEKIFVSCTFANVDMSRAAKDGLDGADIYSGCCTLKIEYAKVSYTLDLLFGKKNIHI